MLSIRCFCEFEKCCEFGILKKNVVLRKKILAEEEAAIPKKNRRILLRQHFEMRSVLV